MTVTNQDKAYEDAVLSMRQDPSMAEVVERAFLHEDPQTALAAFRASEDWSRAKRLLSAMGVAAPARILDFGGGRGLLTASLALEGYRCTLCEINPSHVCGAGAAVDVRERTGAAFEITSERVEALTGEGPFDAVVCRAVLHHVTPLRPVLGDVLSLLRPGGALIACDEPTVRRSEDVQQLRREHPFVPYGLDETALRDDEYLEALTAAGFEGARCLFPVALADYRRHHRPSAPWPLTMALYARYRIRSRLGRRPGDVRAFVARRPG